MHGSGSATVAGAAVCEPSAGGNGSACQSVKLAGADGAPGSVQLVGVLKVQHSSAHGGGDVCLWGVLMTPRSSHG